MQECKSFQQKIIINKDHGYQIDTKHVANKEYESLHLHMKMKTKKRKIIRTILVFQCNNQDRRRKGLLEVFINGMEGESLSHDDVNNDIYYQLSEWLCFGC